MQTACLNSASDSEIYRGLRISCVHGLESEALKEALVDFWLAHRVLPNPEEAEKRASQVVNVVTDAEGRLVGVNTVYTGNLGGQDQRLYWLYRTFILPQYRYSGLSSRVFRMTVRRLSSLPESPGTPVGLLVVAENPKLRTPAGRRKLQRLGLTAIGRDARGCDVWKIDF